MADKRIWTAAIAAAAAACVIAPAPAAHAKTPSASVRYVKGGAVKVMRWRWRRVASAPIPLARPDDLGSPLAAADAADEADASERAEPDAEAEADADADAAAEVAAAEVAADDAAASALAVDEGLARALDGGGQAAAFAALEPGARAATDAETEPEPEPMGPLGFGDRQDPTPLEPLSGDVGFALMDIDSGALLAGRNLDLGLIPASVSKMPTAAYALDTLGPEHRFTTRLLVSGDIVDGALMGDVHLVGSGDPTLRGDHLRVFAAALREAGVERVEGGLYYSAGLWPEVAAIEPAQLDEEGYNPGVGGLNLEGNRFVMGWAPQRGGDPALSAWIDGRQTPADDVRVLLAPKRQRPFYDHGVAAVSEPPFGPSVIERWSVKAGYFKREGRRWLPVRRPSAHAAAAFRAAAREKGVTLPPATRGRAPDGAREIAAHQSAPLRDITRVMLKKSVNIDAEALGLAASVARGVDLSGPDPLAASGAAMSAWLAERYAFAEVAAEPMALDNHSGLSMISRVSARSMALFIALLARDDALYDEMESLTPEYKPGLLGPIAAVRAKTGTVYYGRGLSGYVDCASGRRLSFAFFNSDFETRERFDRMMAEQHIGSTPHSKQWLARARFVERRLLSDWSQRFCPRR